MDWQKEHKNNKQNLTYTHSHRHQQTEKARPNLKQEKAKRKKVVFIKKEKLRSDMREQKIETFRVAARHLQR